MDKEAINKKVSDFIAKITKEGTKYSKLVKKEFDLMMLGRKKKQKFEEMGQLVYLLVKKRAKEMEKNSKVVNIIREIKKIETEEEKVKRSKEGVKKAGVNKRPVPDSPIRKRRKRNKK